MKPAKFTNVGFAHTPHFGPLQRARVKTTGFLLALSACKALRSFGGGALGAENLRPSSQHPDAVYVAPVQGLKGCGTSPRGVGPGWYVAHSGCGASVGETFLPVSGHEAADIPLSPR